jgi:plasmid stabilization system protein ParE
VKVVEFADEAREHAGNIDAWWRANRRAAPDLFTNELDKASLTLAENPALGRRYEPRPGVRRLLLPRTRYHVYFVEESERVLVVAIWGANRGRGPDLY